MWPVGGTDDERRGGVGEPVALPIVWRVGGAGLAAGRAGFALGSLVLVAITAWAFMWPDADRVAAALVAAFSLLLIALAWLSAIRPSVTASDIGLTIRNPLETVVVSWDELVGAVAGFDGITITRLRAPPATIWAVQQANVSTWRGSHTRALEVATTIELLASTRRSTSGTTPSKGDQIAPDAAEVFDAFREPLRFPWRMSRVEAAVIGSLRHSASPLLSAATAVIFGALCVWVLGIVAHDQWDSYVLRDRGVVVQGTVLAVPGLVEVTWPGVAPGSKFLEAGDDAAERLSIGATVDVLSDPQDPSRARLVSFSPNRAESARLVAFGLIALLVSSGYAKWSRWLIVARRNGPPTTRGRHSAGGRH